MRPSSFTRGFTLIELVLVILIASIISAIVLQGMSGMRARKTIDAGVESVIAAFSQAHLDTISSKDDSQWGVSLGTDRVIVYKGPSYVDGAPENTTYLLHPSIEVADVTLAGGGSTVLFDRLYGSTSQSGTFVVRARGDPSISVTVTITGAGAISV
jgi:prepilin-type N-terminal cleavage/methylation domain-containing protein